METILIIIVILLLFPAILPSIGVIFTGLLMSILAGLFLIFDKLRIYFKE